jgi:hypothetical protein
MEKYYDLEINILSCVLQKPKLMENIILEDKYFIKHKKLWLFLKAVYQKFGDLDLQIMYSIIKDKYHFMDYIIWLIDVEPTVSKFNKYQQQLIDLFNETKKEKYIREKIYELANNLLVKNVEINEFKNKVNKIYNDADILFKEI